MGNYKKLDYVPENEHKLSKVFLLLWLWLDSSTIENMKRNTGYLETTYQ